MFKLRFLKKILSNIRDTPFLNRVLVFYFRKNKKKRKEKKKEKEKKRKEKKRKEKRKENK